MVELANVKVGDIVRVKTLEDIRDWEVVHDKQIPYTFTDAMEYLCGNEYVVKNINDARIEPSPSIILEGEERWLISLPMLECIVCEENAHVDINEELLMSFLEV